MTIHDHSTGEQPAEGEQTWSTQQLQEDFEVIGFQAPYVVVRRKSDQQLGTVHPRLYWGFVPDGP
jgi:hypothetical protein